MKASIIALSILVAGEFSYALRIDPARCAADSLPQWTGGNINGTARGRNEWMKVCTFELYDAMFPMGNEFDELTGNNRRLYPTYGIPKGDGKTTQWDYGTWRAPTEAPASADAASCVKPAGYRFVGLCTSGCVTPDSIVTTRQGSIDIETMDLEATNETLVPTQASSESLRLEPMAVKRYTKDIAETKQEILVVKTVSGGSVKVSLNHPLLKGDYTMAKAEDLKVGDSLVTAEGKKDLIVAIEKQKFFGKLHNMTIETNELKKSLYVVQGYISGDKKYQDIEATNFNRQVLREIAAETL